MAIGTPQNVQTAANTSTTTAVISSYASGSESGRTLIVIGCMVRDGNDRTLSCTFGATSLTSESTRQDTAVGVRYRTSVFRLRNVSGTQNITLTASGVIDGIGVIAFYIDGVADQDVEATGNAEDLTNTMTVSVSTTTAGSLVAYGINAEQENEASFTFTGSGLTSLGQIEIDATFGTRIAAGWEEASGTTDSGGWSSESTNFAGTLAGASFTAAAGGATPPGHNGIMMAV